MPSALNDLATSFTIRELTGDERTLTLTGRALPYRPFTLTGSQRTSLGWYPGSPIATLQVFGAKEEPTTINGYWKDVFIGEHLVTNHPPYAELDGEPISDVRQLTEVADDMRRKGQEVEVTWLHLSRRGVINKLEQKWHNGHDVEWEMTLEWTSQAETAQDILSTSSASDLVDVPSIVQSRVDALGVDSSQLLPSAGDQFADAAAAINASVTDLQLRSSELFDLLLTQSTLTASAVDSIARASGVLSGIKQDALDLAGIVGQQSDAIVLNLDQAFGLTLTQRVNLRQQGQAASELAYVAADQQERLRRQVDPEVATAFQARENTDLRDVSLIFYGTPDDWASLMLFNHMQSSRLVAGQTIFVPRTPPPRPQL